MNGKSITTKYLVAHQLEGGESSREGMLTSLKTNKILPDTISIEGILMDDSTNLNNWQVPETEHQSIIDSIVGAPYLKDHNEKVDSVAGQVVAAWKDGNQIKFKAEIDDPGLIRKIIRGTVKYSSVQVDSDQLVCSKCYEDVQSGRLAADEMIRKGEYFSRAANGCGIKHLHAGAHEVVLKPEGKEISAVVFPAYKIAEFGPVGFAAGLNKALGLSNDKRDGDVMETNASDEKQIPESKEVRTMADEKSTNSLTAEEIAKALMASLEKRDQAQKLQAEAVKKQEDVTNFMKTFESAIGKIGELEKNYNAGIQKIEQVLSKYEQIVQKQEEISAAGRTLNEAKAQKREAGDKEACPKCGKPVDECECEKAERKKEETLGKAHVEKDELRTGLDAKLFPGYFKELVATSKKHPRSEA